MHFSAARPAAARLGLAALVLALAGCASSVAPVLPDAVPAAWSQSAGAPGATAPELRSWWRRFGDGRLDALVDEALAQNLTLAQARSRLRQARLLAARSDAQYLPALAANLRTLQDVQAVDSYLHVSLDATWELGLFGARESARDLARGTLATAAATEQAARVSVVAEVVRQYLDLRAAQQQLAILDRLVLLDERATGLADVRMRTRIAAPDERLQLQARIAQVRAQLPEPRHAAFKAAQALALLTGRTAPDPAWNTPAAFPVSGPVTVAQVPADLLRTRPDVQQAEAAVLKASAELGLARADLYPRISLGASYLYSRNLTQNRRNYVESIPVIGPLIDIPLFDWGRRKAQADARGEALDEALLAYRQAVLEGVADAETALSALSVQQERIDQLGAAHAALRRRVESLQVLERTGLGSAFERLAGERGALLAETELASARAQQSLAFVALYKALGGAPLPAEPALAGASAQTPAPMPATLAEVHRP